MSPPTNTTGSHPAAASDPATRSAIGTPATSTNALSVPIRRLDPPQSTAPAVIDAFCSHDHGSSWARNVATRSASSCSPIAAAISPRPARARRNPRFVGSDQRT